MTMEEKKILIGKVVHGKAIGRTVGMPTANVAVSNPDALPEYGVYATRISVRGNSYRSVTNIGLRPTVDDRQEVTVEAYILDFAEDIYGEEVELEVCGLLRPIRRFASLEEVHEQVKKDVEIAKNLLDMDDAK